MDNQVELTMDNFIPSIAPEWTTEHEQILVEWADKAMCYRWLHARSNAMFSSLNAWYTIPVIIISTITGTANFATERVPPEWQSAFSMFVGGFNILAGIITTIQQFLKITQMNEAHRVSSIAWDKFYRNIKIELAKHPDERMPVTQMIKICKEEFDRLMETSPSIPDKIISQFKNDFENNDPNEDPEDPGSFSRIIKPEICDALVSTELSRNPWSSEENKRKRMSQSLNKEKQIYEAVSTFKNTFYNINNREPLETEILDNLKDKYDIVSLTKTIDQMNRNFGVSSISSVSDKFTLNTPKNPKNQGPIPNIV
jgi:hypothetical protein